jgi:hypothetical protein
MSGGGDKVPKYEDLDGDEKTFYDHEMQRVLPFFKTESGRAKIPDYILKKIADARLLKSPKKAQNKEAKTEVHGIHDGIHEITLPTTWLGRSGVSQSSEAEYEEAGSKNGGFAFTEEGLVKMSPEQFLRYSREQREQQQQIKFNYVGSANDKGDVDISPPFRGTFGEEVVRKAADAVSKKRSREGEEQEHEHVKPKNE